MKVSNRFLIPAAFAVGCTIFALGVDAAPVKLDRPHSKVGFTAYTKLFDAVGSFKSFRASGDIDHTKFENSKNLKISVDVSSVDTDSSARDDHLRNEDFFWVEKHPQATFLAKSIKMGKKAGTYDVSGTLTIRGVAKSLTIPVNVMQVEEGGKKMTRIKSAFRVKRQSFGLNFKAGLLMPTIKDKVDIRFDINFSE